MIVALVGGQAVHRDPQYPSVLRKGRTESAVVALRSDGDPPRLVVVPVLVHVATRRRDFARGRSDNAARRFDELGSDCALDEALGVVAPSLSFQNLSPKIQTSRASLGMRGRMWQSLQTCGSRRSTRGWWPGSASFAPHWLQVIRWCGTSIDWVGMYMGISKRGWTYPL